MVGKWGESTEGHRIKAYRLTAAGRRQLERERRHWARVVLAVRQVLESG